MLLLTFCAIAAGARLRSEEEALLPTVTRLLQAKGDPLAMPRETMMKVVAQADGFQVPVPAPMVGAAALARSPPPRMAEEAAKKAPAKKKKKEKKKAPSPFGDQPEVSEPEFSIFERPRDFQGDAGGLPEQWDKYAGGSAIGPSRNFEGPSWERAYKEWEKKGIPRPSTTQKLGYTSGPAGYSRPANKAYVDYESRRPDYSEGPKFRGKPKVTENYKNPRPDLKSDDKK